MAQIDREAVCSFASAEIQQFHRNRLARLENISLTEVLKKKNPYLFRAKNLNTPNDLTVSILGAFLSSSEEKLFGDFLERLAVFVSQQTCGGRKSSVEGIDLEFDQSGTRYMVSVKSGPNWGNSAQHRRLEDDFKRAVKVQKQAHGNLRIQPILGICYGNTATADTGVYRKVVGQSFWYFLSGDPDLYLDILEPIGREAARHNEDFDRQRGCIVTRFTAEFTQSFCTPAYDVDWPKLVAFNSGNLAEE